MISFQPKSVQKLNCVNYTLLAAHHNAYHLMSNIIFKGLHFFFCIFYYALNSKARYTKISEVINQANCQYFQDLMKLREKYAVRLLSIILDPSLKYRRVTNVEVEPLEIETKLKGQSVKIPTPQHNSIKCMLFMKRDCLREVTNKPLS